MPIWLLRVVSGFSVHSLVCSWVNNWVYVNYYARKPCLLLGWPETETAALTEVLQWEVIRLKAI